jgi:hypothetical protein
MFCCVEFGEPGSASQWRERDPALSLYTRPNMWYAYQHHCECAFADHVWPRADFGHEQELDPIAVKQNHVQVSQTGDGLF